MASRVGASLGSEEPELLRVGWERRILLVRPTLGLGKADQEFGEQSCDYGSV